MMDKPNIRNTAMKREEIMTKEKRSEMCELYDCEEFITREELIERIGLEEVEKIEREALQSEEDML